MGLTSHGHPVHLPDFNPAEDNIILSDTDGSSSISFGVFGVPETILINSNQIVIKKFIGPLDTKDYKNILNVIYEN